MIEKFLDLICDLRAYFMTEYCQDIEKIEIDPMLEVELMQSLSKGFPEFLGFTGRPRTIHGIPIKVIHEKYRTDGRYFAVYTKR